MRKSTFFLVFLACLATLCVKATPIDSTAAIQYAKQYYGGLTRLSERQIQTLPASIAKCAYYQTTQGEKAPAYYIVTFGKRGFVILTGDTQLLPVIGYSTESAFQVDRMPENIASWLEMRRQEVEYAMNNIANPEPEAVSQWEQLSQLGVTATAVVSPLLATTWDQNAYYNDLCPMDPDGSNGHAYAGCVATAMAQIIRYWEWPTSGIGSHSYTCDYGTLTANFGAATYNYDNMPNAISGNSTPTQINEVATLIYHCGVSVNMGYGISGSSAYSGYVPGALQDYFAYSENGTMLAKSDYTDDEWAAMIRNELNNVRPVYYDGSGTAGHAFVCDGYNNDGTFHFNWGWSGYYNGDFTLNSLNPGSNDFSSYQNAIFGISATGPFLRCSHNAMTFAAAVGTESEIQTLQVRGRSLDNNITVTAGNWFKVSTDGNNFYNSVTLPANGGNVYVKYIPTSSDNVSLTLTVVSGTYSANVTLYGAAYTEVCLPPTYLTGTYNGSAVNLSWNSPINYSSGSPSSATLSWDSTFSGYRAGIGTDMTLYMMHRFDTQELNPFDNYVLKSITFYALPDATTYRAVVFTGCSYEGSFIPGTMVVNQEIPASSISTNNWNTVLLNNPVLINSDEEIAFGVAIYTTGTDGYVLPIGTGTFAPNKGEIFGYDYTNNSENTNSVYWYNFSNIFGEYNLALKGRVEKIAGDVSHYDVYRGSILIGNSTSTSYSDNHQLTESTPYTVSAIWSSGCTADATIAVDLGSTTPPTVVTSNVILVNPATATGGGNVTSMGSSSVTARGVCWSTSQNPTILNDHTNDGSGSGEFTSNITGLNENTTYYVRAYAMNSAGVAYGEQLSFTTGSWGTPCTLTIEMHDSYGDGWNGNIIKVHNRGTTQTVTLSSGTSETVNVDVYNGSLELEWANGSYSEECSFTVSGPCLYYQALDAPSAGIFISREIDCGDISFVPDFTYTLSSTCNSTLYEFTSAGENLQTVSWDFGGGNTSSQNPATFEYTTSGTYTVSMTAANDACPTAATISKDISVEISEPIHTILDTVVCATELPLTWHGHTFTSAETYTETYTGADNCENTMTLNLRVGVLAALLDDDFNDGVIDPAKWTYTGNAVVEEDGILKLYQNVTDQDVHLRSVNLDVPEDGKVSMDRKFIVHRSSDYYYGSTCYYLNGNDNSYVNLQYIYTAYYDEGYYDNNNPRNGVFVTSKLGDEVSTVRLCEIVFDTWLTEHIDLDFTEGTLTYRVGSTTVSTSIPELAAQTVNSFYVEYRPYGWWTGHQHYMDYVNIYGIQNSVTVTTSSVSNITSTEATCGGSISANDCILFSERGVCWSTSANPTVAGAHTIDGTGTGAFTSQLTGLEPNTTYYVRAYSINSMGTAYGEEVSFTTTTSFSVQDGQPCPGVSSLTDYDGNVYNTVQIGIQCWMKENLRTTHYADGTYIEMGTSTSTTMPYYYNFFDDNANYVATYGYLYNWPAVMHGFASSETNPSNVQGICPTGWHVPSNAEWTQLTDYVSSQSEYWCGGNNTYIAKALASNGGWFSSTHDCAVGNDPSANNATGFSAVAASYYSDYYYYDLGTVTYFWSATAYDENDVFYLSLFVESAYVNKRVIGGRNGFSVRCLHDENGGSGTDTTQTSQTTVPTVTTGTVSDITETTATCSGEVTADGGALVTERGICWGTSSNPTVGGNHLAVGMGIGLVNACISGLTSNTTYYVRAYATNSAGTAYGEEVTFTTTTSQDGQPCPGTPTVTDIDGNVYNTVQIGSQCWMKENLRTTRYADGTAIEAGSSGSTTIPYRYTPVYFGYNVAIGYLYNGSAVMHGASPSSANPSGVQGICPTGWHVPSEAEWNQLTNYVGSQSEYRCGGSNSNIAKALAATTWWYSYENYCAVGNDLSANNATGFSVLPAGGYYLGGIYSHTTLARFWSTTSGNGSWYEGRSLSANEAYITLCLNSMDDGYSVRCILNDNTTSATLPTVTTNNVSDITSTTATCGGNVTADGGATVTARGVYWSTFQNPTLADAHTTDGTGTGAFTSQLTGLEPNTTYYVRAYATNSEGTAYGEEVSFTTSEPDPIPIPEYVVYPNHRCVEPYDGAIVLADLPDGCVYEIFSDENGVNAVGFNELAGDQTYWVRITSAYGYETIFDVYVPNTITYPEFHGEVFVYASTYCTNDNGRIDIYPEDGFSYYVFDATGNEIHDFYQNLSPGDYFVLKEDNSTFCISDMMVTIENIADDILVSPMVMPNHACVEDLYDGTILVEATGGSGMFEFSLNGEEFGPDNLWTSLGPGMYYIIVRDILSGCEVIVDAIVEYDNYCAPVLNVENRPFCLNEENATLTATAISDCGDDFTYRWHRDCHNLYFEGAIVPVATDEEMGCIYSVTATSIATGCMSTASVAVLVYNQPPTVTTNSVTGITSTSAECGGNVTDAGCAVVTARGVCWSTSQNPTIADAHTSDSMGTGSFTSSITELTPNTTYYVRAYATNSAGTVYGEEVTFTTECTPATVFIGDSIMCEGGTMLFASVSSALDPYTVPEYIWFKDGNIIASGSFNEFPVFETGVYKVAVNINGCTSESEEFFVEEYVALDILLSASETDLCIGGSTYINADAVGGSYGEVSYNWYLNASYYGSSSLISFAPTHPDVYYFEVFATDQYTGCESFAYITINVNDVPETPVVATDNDTVCEGGQVTLTVTNPVDGAIYTWYRNGILIEGATQATLVETPIADGGENTVYIYNVAATLSNSGCSSAISGNITVTAAPAPSFVLIDGENVICENSNAVLTALSDVPGTFTWSDGSYGSSITVPAGIYTVFLTTEGGCTLSSTPFVVESFSTDILVSASTTHICEGEYATLYVDIDGSQGNVSYLWDAMADYSNSSTVIVAPAVTSIYHVTATVSSPDISCSVEGDILINVSPLPAQATVTASELEICDGGQVTLTAHSPDAIAYIWYLNGVEVAGENQAVLTVYLDQTEAYQFAVKAISEEGCVSALASEPVTVTVSTPATVIIADSIMCEGGAMLTAVLIPEADPDAQLVYTWFKDGQPMDIVSSDHILASESGLYMVEVSQNGCLSASSDVFVDEYHAPQLFLTASETDLCVGGTTVITAEATAWNPDNFSYSWSVGYSGSTYAFVPDHAGAYTFWVTATNEFSGCESAESITINVNDLPETPIVTADNTAIFEGGQITLTVTNSVAGATYTWYRNGNLIEGATQTTLVETPATVGEYTYTVIATLYNSGCVSAPSVPTTVTVSETPVAMITVNGNTVFCDGGSTTLHANVVPAGNPSYTYQWYEDGELIPGATMPDYVVNENARETAYNFSVVVSANGGFSVTAYAPAVTVVEDPQVTVTVSEDIICVGGTATLTAIIEGGVASINGSNDYNYQWFRTLQTTTEPVGTGYSYTISDTEPAGNYSYWVEVSNSYSCNSQSTPVSITVVNNPTVTITRAAGYDETVCEGGSTALVANVSDGYGTTYYQWYKNGLILQNETGAVLNIDNLTADADDVYAVSVSQEGSGCGSGLVSAAISSLVTVSTPATVILADSIMCGGGAMLTAVLIPEADPDAQLVYTWFKDGQPMDIVSSDYILASEPGLYKVAVSQDGCTSESDEYYVTFHSIPQLQLVGPAAVCVGEAATITAEVNSWHEGGVTFSWSVDNFSGFTYTFVPDHAGSFTFEVTATDVLSGCAASDYITIIVNDATAFTFTSTTCDIFEWNGVFYTESGDYTQTFTAANGCDSVVTMILTVTPPQHLSYTVTACESFEWHGVIYDESGIYTYDYTNNDGCASVDTLKLTVNYGTHNVDTVTVCESFEWHGVIYNESGIYTYDYTNNDGCASVDTLILTVNYGTHNVDTVTACESFEWHGVIYDESGIYTYDYTNNDGCASVDTLILTVNYGTHNVDTETACESFEWHGVTYDESGIYTYDYTNQDGCASMDTLLLTINSSATTDVEVTCPDSCYLWNGVPYCTSGDYTQTLQTEQGCDSVVTLHLSITVGIDDHNGFDFSVYPNPTTGVANVQCTMNNEQMGTMKYQVFDAYGKLIQITDGVETRCTTSLRTAQIDLSGFANGVYFIKAVMDGNIVAVRKVVKQ